MTKSCSFSLFLRVICSVYSFLILLAICIYSYFFLDQPIAFYMQKLPQTHPEYVSVAQWITQIGEGAYYFIGLPILFLICHFIRKNLRCSRICIFLFSVILVTGLIGQMIKCLLGRYRPSMLFLHHQYGFHFFQIHSTQLSFPSGHSLLITSLMIGLSYIWRKYWGYFMIIALTVSFSRVIVTAHYPTDVMAGMYLSFLVVPWIHERWFKTLRL